MPFFAIARRVGLRGPALSRGFDSFSAFRSSTPSTLLGRFTRANQQISDFGLTRARGSFSSGGRLSVAGVPGSSFRRLANDFATHNPAAHLQGVQAWEFVWRQLVPGLREDIRAVTPVRTGRLRSSVQARFGSGVIGVGQGKKLFSPIPSPTQGSFVLSVGSAVDYARPAVGEVWDAPFREALISGVADSWRAYILRAFGALG